jgi:hypothetical protein
MLHMIAWLINPLRSYATPGTASFDQQGQFPDDTSMTPHRLACGLLNES